MKLVTVFDKIVDENFLDETYEGSLKNFSTFLEIIVNETENHSNEIISHV